MKHFKVKEKKGAPKPIKAVFFFVLALFLYCARKEVHPSWGAWLTLASKFIIADSGLIRICKLDEIESRQSQTGPFQGILHYCKEFHKEIHTTKRCPQQHWSKHLRWAGLWGEVTSLAGPRLQEWYSAALYSAVTMYCEWNNMNSCVPTVFLRNDVILLPLFSWALCSSGSLLNCCGVLIHSDKRLPDSSPEEAAVLRWVEWHSDAGAFFFLTECFGILLAAECCMNAVHHYQVNCVIL